MVASSSASLLPLHGCRSAQAPIAPADASATRLLQTRAVPADQRRIKVGSTFAQRLDARLGDAGGEEAEIIGERAVGEVGDARAQDGDRLGR